MPQATIPTTTIAAAVTCCVHAAASHSLSWGTGSPPGAVTATGANSFIAKPFHVLSGSSVPHTSQQSRVRAAQLDAGKPTTVVHTYLAQLLPP